MDWADIKSVDSSMFNCLKSIEEMKEEELEYLDTKFVISLFDASQIELKPNGRDIVLR